MMMMNRRPINLITTALIAASAAASDVVQLTPETMLEGPHFFGLPTQLLDTPFYGQHVGAAYADLNGDGAIDLLFAAGRHWVDQSYALINLGPEYDDNDKFTGVRFSEAQPIGPPGGYYNIDIKPSSKTDSSTQHSTVLLVGGTCHAEKPNSLGSCKHGDNTPARIVHVSMSKEAGGGCSIHEPDADCNLEYTEVWEHPNPKGDRNGGFATFDDQEMVALLGQGGIELFESAESTTPKNNNIKRVSRRKLLHSSYSSVFHDKPPTKTDPRSDYARYAGFAAGHLPTLGGVVAAGRRSDFDAPQKDSDGNVMGINKLVYEDEQSSFQSSTLPSNITGEPYPGNPKISIQTTNYAFADINGDGVQDLLEATFLYNSQRVPEYPLPQRVHFLDEKGQLKETLVVLEDGSENKHEDDYDAGRSVTTGQIFSDSSLPDVVFASAKGVVTLFANLGVDKEMGNFRGLEMRYQLSVGTDKCQIRDVVVTKLAQERSSGKCWVGIVSAVTCGLDILGRNSIFYVEGSGTVCNDDGGGDVKSTSILSEREAPTLALERK